MVCSLCYAACDIAMVCGLSDTSYDYAIWSQTWLINELITGNLIIVVIVGGGDWFMQNVNIYAVMR